MNRGALDPLKSYFLLTTAILLAVFLSNIIDKIVSERFQTKTEVDVRMPIVKDSKIFLKCFFVLVPAFPLKLRV